MWWVEVTVTLHPIDDGLRALALKAYDELRKLGNIDRPEMSGTLGEGRLSLSMVIPNDDRIESIQAACIATRTALHAAGARTPEWERMVKEAVEQARMTCEPALVPA